MSSIHWKPLRKREKTLIFHVFICKYLINWRLEVLIPKVNVVEVLTKFFFVVAKIFGYMMRLMIYFELLLCVILSFIISKHYSMKLSTIKNNFKILTHSKSMIMMVSQHINHYNLMPKVVTGNRKYSIDGNWKILNSNILYNICILIIFHHHNHSHSCHSHHNLSSSSSSSS